MSNSITLAKEIEPRLVKIALAALSAHTEYALSELTNDLDFHSDLGIDSILLSTLVSELSDALGISSAPEMQNIESIEDLLLALQEKVTEEGIDMDSVTLDNPARKTIDNSDHSAMIHQHVYHAFALHSGYTTDDLDPDSDFESDLGIDSITHISILSELKKTFDMENADLPHDLNTLAKVCAFFVSKLDGIPLNVSALDKHIETDHITTESDIGVNETYAEVPDDKSLAGYDTMQDFVAIENKDLFHKTREFARFYANKREQNLLWYGMPLASSCKNRAVIYDDIAGKNREFLMFASNNYLGLANAPEVTDAIADAAKTYGATNTGCRLIGGSNVLHLELEEKLAKLKGRESCIVFPSGYSANLGTISGLCSRKDLVFTDAINHMSIQDGCKLSGAQRKIYNHSMDSLEKTLAKYADHPGGKLIVTDGVFSMHGDIVDLPRLNALAKTYGAKVLVDDAHSTGVLGATGSGTTEHFNMKGEVDLELGTMSKALSGLGGFVCGDGDVVDFLRFYANSYVFAATIPAPVAAGVIASIDVMIKEPERLQQLWKNIHYLRAKYLSVGFNLEESNSAIIPIVIGDDDLTLRLGRAVRARGMYCQTVVYPGVSVGDARLRISISSEHTKEDLDLAAQIVIEAAQEVGILS